jgi:SAM-dependent methyltransferase
VISLEMPSAMERSGQRRWNLNTHYHRIVLDSIPAGATTALDIGSGNGLLSFDLAARGLQVVGIDPDEASIERARSDPDWSDRTTFLHGDVFTYPFEAGSFDLVTASAMLHHVDAVQGLRRMAELVRPGGVVAIVGFANPSGPVDWALIVAGFFATKARAVTGRYWEHHAPIRWPPPLTIDEMRTLAELEMPGATFKRRMAYRYSIVWSRPIGTTSP